MDASVQGIWRGLGVDLRRFIARRVRDDAAAEDILQETFLKIHQRLPDLRDEERLAPWVYAIARRSILDHHRRAPPTAAAGEGASVEELGDADEEGENLNEEVATWLRPMIQALPEEYRTALELTELEGLTQTELAARLGISVSGAKSRVQRGRQRLKQLVEGCCRLEQDTRGNVIGYEPRADCCQKPRLD